MTDGLRNFSFHVRNTPGEVGIPCREPIAIRKFNLAFRVANATYSTTAANTIISQKLADFYSSFSLASNFFELLTWQRLFNG